MRYFFIKFLCLKVLLVEDNILCQYISWFTEIFKFALYHLDINSKCDFVLQFMIKTTRNYQGFRLDQNFIC